LHSYASPEAKRFLWHKDHRGLRGGWLFRLERICSATENCIGTIGGIGCIRMLYRRPMTPMPPMLLVVSVFLSA
jgi:hypothetical protein